MNDQTQTLLEIYRMLESHGCKFIRVHANSKRPEGKWDDDSGTAWLNVEQAVSRLESKAGNVGVVPRGNVFVIDLDGDDAIERFENECESLPDFETFAVSTPNGAHVYFRASEPDLIPVTVGKTYWGEGIDIRSPNANSQVIGPGSYVQADKPEKNSGTYEIANDAPIAIAPEKIEALSRKQLKVRNQQAPAPASKQPDSDTSEVRHKPALKTCRNVIHKAIRKIEQAKPGTRNDTIAKYAALAGSYAVHYPDEFGEDVEEKIGDAVDSIATDSDCYGESDKHLKTAESQYQWGLKHPHYVEDSEKEVKNEPDQFLNILNLMGFKGRFNLEKDRNEWLLPDIASGELVSRDMSRSETDLLFARIWNDYDWNIRSSEVRRTLLTYAAMQNKVRPTLEYLQGCKPDIEFANVTLENWLSHWLDNPDGEIERWASKAMLVQIVSRVMGDPRPQRIIVTLRGPGDTGKSTLVQNLLPDALDAVGDLNAGGSDRDIIAQLGGGYIVEFSELVGMNRKDAAALKSLLGAGSKRLRKLYSEGATKRTYTAAIFGTTNLDRVLYDDEALISRFVFVDFHRSDIDPAEYIPKVRDHLFALAMESYQAGFESNILPVHLRERQIEQAELSVNRDRTLNDQYSEVDWHQVPKRFKIIEFAGYMGLARDRSQYLRLKLHLTLPKFLRERGFIVKKGKGNAEWWERPPNSDLALPHTDLSQNALDKRRKRAAIAYEKLSPRVPLLQMHYEDNKQNGSGGFDML